MRSTTLQESTADLENKMSFFFFLPGVELALFGSLLLEDTSVFNLHWTGDETDFTAFLHQASYPPVIVEFLHGIIKDKLS